MRSLNKVNQKKRRSRFWKRFFIIIGTIIVLLGIGLFTFFMIRGQEETAPEEPPTTESPAPEDDPAQDPIEEEPIEEEPVVEEEPEPTFIDIRLSATGDVMGHGGQLKAAYDANTDTYDFNSVFEDIIPVLADSDLAFANLETTLAGPSRPYIGYPTFNTPDTLIDALANTGFNTIVTTNNHSLDTRAEGLKRTVEVIEDKGLDVVGTYAETPDSRVLLKDVNGISVAVLAYTESLNGMEALYSTEELHTMIDTINEEQIKKDIAEAKSLEPDLIVTYMHWGAEYAAEPNDYQRRYAELLTKEGVDLILGSHPHVVQRAEMLEVDGNEAFVVYSMGNFVSNQRRESLGAGFEPTEDGVIINFDIQKNELTEETTIQNIEFVPTWVYRTTESGASTYTYKVLPAERYLSNPYLSEAVNSRVRESYARTLQRLDFEFEPDGEETTEEVEEETDEEPDEVDDAA